MTEAPPPGLVDLLETVVVKLNEAGYDVVPHGELDQARDLACRLEAAIANLQSDDTSTLMARRIQEFLGEYRYHDRVPQDRLQDLWDALITEALDQAGVRSSS